MSDRPARAASEVSPAELFPQLERLRAGRRHKVPFIQQVEMADCGAACLGMVLAYMGHHAGLDELRETVGVSQRDGVDAASIVRGAEWYGLRGRGLSLDVDHLKYLPPATILHWDFNHFVVLEKVSKRGVH